MMADTWLGAFAWADGNQMWSGNRPALMPNPRSISQNNGARSARSRIGPSSQLPVRTASMAKNAKSASTATCDTARYSQPAARTSRCWRSSVIRKYAASVNSSHAMRKCSPLDTSSTSAMLVIRTVHQKRPARADRGCTSSPQYSRAYARTHPADDAHQRQEQRADGIQAQVDRLPSHQHGSPPLPLCAGGKYHHRRRECHDRGAQRRTEPEARSRTRRKHTSEHRDGRDHEQQADGHVTTLPAPRCRWASADGEDGCDRGASGGKETPIGADSSSPAVSGRTDEACRPALNGHSILGGKSGFRKPRPRSSTRRNSPRAATKSARWPAPNTLPVPAFSTIPTWMAGLP